MELCVLQHKLFLSLPQLAAFLDDTEEETQDQIVGFNYCLDYNTVIEFHIRPSDSTKYILAESIVDFLSYLCERPRRNREKLEYARVNLIQTLKTYKKKKRKRWPESVRNQILYDQDYKCNVCRIKIPPQHQFDHIVALEDGGEDAIENLQALCGTCHDNKTHANRLRKMPISRRRFEELHTHYQPTLKKTKTETNINLFSNYFVSK